MATVSVAAGRPLGFGRVFNSTFGVIGRNWLTIAVISLLFGVAPGVLISRAHIWLGLKSSVEARLIASIVDMAVRLIPYSMLYGAAAGLVSKDIEGRTVGLASLLAGAATAFPFVLLTNVLYEFGMVAGFALLVIPGVILLLMWNVALPAAAIERRSPVGSLKRSAELTRTHRGEIFGLILAYGLPFIILSYGGRAVLHAIGLSTNLYDWPMIAFRAAEGFVSYPFGAVFTAVLYFELRRLKDGLLPSEASVFD